MYKDLNSNNPQALGKRCVFMKAAIAKLFDTRRTPN
jgi:hypothetical protein